MTTKRALGVLVPLEKIYAMNRKICIFFKMKFLPKIKISSNITQLSIALAP